MNGAIAIQGFALSLGLIIAIGPQNAFVLRQGLKRRHVGAVASFCFLSDALLIGIGVGGAASLFALNPLLETVMTWVGIAFIVGYGALALRAAMQPAALHPDAADTGKGELTRRAALGIAAAFTWLNPHAYVDTQVLIGGVATGYEFPDKLAFFLGAVAGSAVWFYGLGYGARRMSGFFASPRAWRMLDLGIAAVMWIIAGLLIANRLG